MIHQLTMTIKYQPIVLVNSSAYSLYLSFICFLMSFKFTYFSISLFLPGSQISSIMVSGFTTNQHRYYQRIMGSVFQYIWSVQNRN